MEGETVLRKSEKKKLKEKEAISTSQVPTEKKKKLKDSKEKEALSSSTEKKTHKESKEKESLCTSEVPAVKQKHKKDKETASTSSLEVPTEKKKHKKSKEKKAASSSDVPTDAGSEEKGKGSGEKEGVCDINGKEVIGKSKRKKDKEKVTGCSYLECASDQAALKRKDPIDVCSEENVEHMKKGKGKRDKRKNENGGESGESCTEKSGGEAQSGSGSSRKRDREEEVLDVTIEGNNKKKKKKMKKTSPEVNVENKEASIRDVEMQNNLESTDESLRNSDSEKSSKKVKFASQVEVFAAPDDKDDQEESQGKKLIQGKRFTKQEDQLIKDAVYNYIEAQKLGEEGLDMILHCSRHPSLSDCWKEIGAAFTHRPRKAVYHRAHALFEKEDLEKNSEKKLVHGKKLIHGKRFTKIEDQIIKDAVYSYIEARKLGEKGLDMILHCQKHQSVRNCWKEIGIALPYRPYGAVYERAHILFERAESHKWTEDEKAFVLKFYEKHGPDWKSLAKVLGKHPKHTKDMFRNIRFKDRRNGKWSQAEYQSLFHLVNMDLRMRVFEEKTSMHGMLRDNISWTVISRRLATRPHSDCCTKWYTQLTSSLVREQKWADTDDYRLLDELYKLDACCVEDVDWDNLLEHRPGDVTLKRWRQMINHIGEHGLQSFSKQVEALCKRCCPELLEVRETLDSRPLVD